MQNLNYKKNKIETEIDSLNQEKGIYLENIKKNKVSKKNMIMYPLLPVIGGIISFGIYLAMYKTLPPIEFYNCASVIILAMESIFAHEEIEQIINYNDSKKELEKTSLEEIEKEISLKEKEKTKILEDNKNSLVNTKTLSNDDPIFETRDMYLDNTMHFTDSLEEKVLVKKK